MSTFYKIFLTKSPTRDVLGIFRNNIFDGCL